jgi:membrane protease YdiL (CAAX protease family)
VEPEYPSPEPTEQKPPGPARNNPCESAPDLPVRGFCLLCGRPAQGWGALPPEFATHGQWRCQACYQPLQEAALHCGHCGRQVSAEYAAIWREAHERAGRLCAAALVDAPIPLVRSTSTAMDRELKPIRDVGYFFAAMLAPILVLYGWSFHVGEPPLALQFVLEAVLYLVIAGYAWHWRTLLAPMLLSPPSRPRYFFGLVALTPLFTLMVVFLMSTLLRPLSQSTHPFRYSEPLLKAGYGWWAVYLSTAVFPAVFEEIAFRGLILKKLEIVMAPTQALLVTSLMFAIIHYNLPGLVIFLVPLALAAGWLVQKSGSLWPAIAVHFLHNCGVVLHEQLTS